MMKNMATGISKTISIFLKIFFIGMSLYVNLEYLILKRASA